MTAGDEILVLITKAPLFLPVLVMVLCRIGGLMLTAPIFGSQTVPVTIRAGLAVVISFVLFPTVLGSVPADLPLGSAVAGIFGELLIGLTLGSAASVMFLALQVAGMIVGQQAGLALGQVFNPVLDDESSLLGEVFFMTVVTAFVVMDGHRELLRALLDTYKVIPVMSFRFGPPLLDLLTDLLAGAYAVALRIAAPVLISLLVATLALGFLSRTMPQLNILSVGFVVRVFATLGLGGFALAAADGLLESWFSEVVDAMRQAFGLA